MSNAFVVLKFGGTSVRSAERWRTIAREAQRCLDAGERPVLVCSAVAGVSNDIEALLKAAPDDAHGPLLERIEQTHRALADDFCVDPEPALERWFQPLIRLATGAALTGEATPRVRARAMAVGEQLSTALGAVYLREKLGLDVAWHDAREWLVSVPEAGARGYLSATCDDAHDPELGARLDGAAIALTQGFIASNPQGETVLLGRGGSDTSGALIAARLGAKRCEIWTDVAGIFTANPRDVPGARVLRRLDYDEAQEVATAGARVLHPRCLAPVRRHRIPLHVKCTLEPDRPGTVIGGDVRAEAAVKAIAARRGVTLVSMDTLGMWQQVGFLADVFACFKRHGVSVDLVSTSEANVTASIDAAAGALEPGALDALRQDLSALCTVRTITDCAAVSLVGRGIRSILHQLGPALAVFESERIHLVAQAASDLNLTFVVDEAQVDRLVRALHALVFEAPRDDVMPASATAPRDAWWRRARDRLLAVVDEGSPVFAYDGATLDAAAGRLKALGSVDRVLFAVKANDHPDVLRRLERNGLDFECVSPGEVAQVRAALPELPVERILFTPNFAPRQEYVDALEEGLLITVDNLHPLEKWPEVFRGRDILLRLDPGRGRGHHAHVRTAGAQSKFGIAPEQLDAVVAAVETAGARVVGLHAHAGSGIRTHVAWPETAMFLMQAAERFPDVEVLDLGGGLGIREKPGQSRLDLSAVDAELARFREAHPGVRLWLEPGRYLVAEAGVLLARVTQTKRKGEVNYVGVDVGMNTLIRPALYGAWHRIVNLSRIDDPAGERAHVVGPICETGDTLGYGRRLPRTEEGDVLLIATVGAYGRTMSSRYNRREPAREVLLD